MCIVHYEINIDGEGPYREVFMSRITLVSVTSPHCW